ncbi:MAG: hypothetical protein KME13_26845 [Myxacorys californica WJT36-NPBG1]|jgi:hypothetical protein|nr:hypothetical protein [Myxacorys californica WJT36-NPBG1]
MINVKNLVKILIVGAVFTASVQMFITPVSKPVQQSAETKQKLQEIDELLERGDRVAVLRMHGEQF